MSWLNEASVVVDNVSTTTTFDAAVTAVVQILKQAFRWWRIMYHVCQTVRLLPPLPSSSLVVSFGYVTILTRISYGGDQYNLSSVHAPWTVLYHRLGGQTPGIGGP